MIQDEIVHWWKDEAGELHKNALRLETEPPEPNGGFPRDGTVWLKLLNTNSNQAIKLNPDEALRIGTQLMSIARELLNQKRALWKQE